MCAYHHHSLIPRKKCNAIEYENDKKKDERKHIYIRAVLSHHSQHPSNDISWRSLHGADGGERLAGHPSYGYIK